MKNILFSTDFSDGANNAFLYALQLANQLDTKLYVLYSYISPVLSATHAGQPELLGQVYEQIELTKFDYYKKQIPQLHELAQKHNLDHSKMMFLFEEGTVVAAVKKSVQQENIALVVMGTHGTSGFKNEFIGSNTVNVIRNIKAPVLAIPAKAAYSAIQKVAFTTLFREKDQAALKEILDLAKVVDATVYCTNVITENSDPADALFYGESWRKLFPDCKLEFTFLKNEDTVENTINRFIKESNIDLLAIVKRNRSFFDRLFSSSLSNNLTFHAEIPILVFHEE
ncbi:universal stress protein [Sphingobacterium lumbrici]|uniref:universal stress protein n=1 Tax=Sphingobacterium lumbrici TaxID=2559600 RepID=UPI00112B7306|nr:universal stress protein [Sphingobacterium lumbrici]